LQVGAEFLPWRAACQDGVGCARPLGRSHAEGKRDGKESGDCWARCRTPGL